MDCLREILEQDRAEAADRAMISASPEGLRFQRYERPASLDLHRCLRQLDR